MQTALYYLKSVPFQILNVSSLSSPNQTIETILGQLFVEDWIEEVSFEQYYKECAPVFCQFSYLSKFNQAYFMTTILAALGGLTKALHFAISSIALLVFAIINWKKRNQVIPQSDTKVVDVDGRAPEVVDPAPEVVISNSPVTTVEVISFYFA